MGIVIDSATPLLQVFDMPTSIGFYCDVLGFEIVSTSQAGSEFDWALLQLNGVYLMLNTAYEKESRPAGPDPTRIAAHEDAAIFFQCADVDAAYAHLCSKGLKVKPPAIQAYGMKQLYVTDPDGFSLCFQWPAKYVEAKD